MGWKNLSIVQFQNVAFLYLVYDDMALPRLTNQNPNISFNITTLKLVC